MAKPASVKTATPRASRTYQTVEIHDLSGGLDLRRAATLLAPDRSRVLMNYQIVTPDGKRWIIKGVEILAHGRRFRVKCLESQTTTD
mgnify:CR=1 FL=1